jgi:membrane protein YqaA with SNARE-associated domain
VIPEALAAVGVGFVSALLPVVSAEAFQAGASLLQPTPVVVACVVALTVGQTGGKVVIFTASRRGATRWRSTHAGRPSRAPACLKWINAKLLQWLSHPIGGPAAVAVSATVGLPPLAIVSATAGASTIRCCVFAIACLVGRLVRFAALAGLVAALTA